MAAVRKPRKTADSRLLDRMGTTTALARQFEVTPQCVSNWKRVGIPRARRQTMALLYPDAFK